jgi:3-deoxy-D-arabino-heptulosonate 7-phosphate (DAHP) synthase
MGQIKMIKCKKENGQSIHHQQQEVCKEVTVDISRKRNIIAKLFLTFGLLFI